MWLTALFSARRRALRPLLFALVSCACLAAATGHAAEMNTDSEEAAHLQHIIGYIEWPASAFASSASALLVGVAGSDTTLASLSRNMAGKQVKGRPVEVLRLERPEQLAQVHMAYVGREAWAQFPEWVTASRQHAVLLATNVPDGVARGAALGLIQSTPQRLRFEASVPAAAQAGVKLSARLLEVADRVLGSDGKPLKGTPP